MKWILASIGLAMLSSGADAAVVLDQSAFIVLQPGKTVRSSSGLRSTAAAGVVNQTLQNFTVGRNGTLSRIEVQIWGWADTPGLNITLYQGLRDQPGFSALGTFTATSLPTQNGVNAGAFVSIDVSSLAAKVFAGDRLTIGASPVVPATGANSLFWVVGQTDNGDPPTEVLMFMVVASQKLHLTPASLG